jgi:hypothetical protein
VSFTPPRCLFFGDRLKESARRLTVFERRFVPLICHSMNQRLPPRIGWRTFWTTILIAWAMALRSGAVTLDLDFRPTWDAKPLEFEALRHETGAGELLSVTRLSALLSGAALETADGTSTDSRRLARKALKMLERGEFRVAPAHGEQLTYRP